MKSDLSIQKINKMKNRKEYRERAENGDRPFHAEGGTRTRTLLRAGDFKSPVSAIPPLQRMELLYQKTF